MQEIEMKSASLALTPLMLAERDREFLKQLRKCVEYVIWTLTINPKLFRNRDAEEKLMANVEGWEVGTFYGHKVYKVGVLISFK
jgi:NADH dehydrogenase (ubiquinone) 1 alpha subcomplex subunit 13